MNVERLITRKRERPKKFKDLILQLTYLRVLFFFLKKYHNLGVDALSDKTRTADKSGSPDSESGGAGEGGKEIWGRTITFF